MYSGRASPRGNDGVLLQQVPDFGCGAEGLGLRVYGLGFRV